MKQVFTFAELASIFSQVEKVKDSVNHFATIAEEYDKLDAAFEDEFAKYDYSFFLAPQELHDKFEKKSAAMKERDLAGRKAFNAIRKFGELIGIGENYVDIVEERVMRFIQGKYYWQTTDMVEKVKILAITASRQIDYNA